MFKTPELAQAVEREALRRKLSAGEVLMTVGEPITHIPIVVSGSLRILAQNAKGQERFLYHIMPGETCAMSLSCCTGNQPSPVVAVVEEDAELLMIPARFMEEWMAYPEWRRFVSDTQNQRFNELLEAIEVVAFSRLDEQLWTYLVKRVQATGDHTLKVTHQEVAQELNSPREVITRLLHQLAHKGGLARSHRSDDQVNAEGGACNGCGGGVG
ncbi:MAG: Crp/Fnr family transcriptional regulator [Flavobacteriales bacterium]